MSYSMTLTGKCETEPLIGKIQGRVLPELCLHYHLNSSSYPLHMNYCRTEWLGLLTPRNFSFLTIFSITILLKWHGSTKDYIQDYFSQEKYLNSTFLAYQADQSFPTSTLFNNKNGQKLRM